MSKFLGTVNVNTGPGGDEGGELVLAPAVTNTTVSGNVVIDVYQNKLRIYESTGNNRGAYIDITAASNGVGSNLLAGGGGGATTLDGLTDVTAPSPSTGDFLKWNGSAWVNDPINLGTDTVGDYVASLVAGTGITITNNSGEGATPTVALTNSSLTIGSTSISLGSTASTLAGLTSVSATTFTGALTGNASTATTLQTARNINGVSFNGSADITVTADAGTLTGTTLNSTVTASSLTSVGSLTALTVAGTTNVQQIREKVSDSSISSNVMTCDYSTGTIFYQATAPSANFTVNVTNLPTDIGNAMVISVFVTQGATGYIPSALQIAGLSVTIKWSGGSAPTPTSSSGKIDLFTFTLIRRGSPAGWTALGSANLNY